MRARIGPWPYMGAVPPRPPTARPAETGLDLSFLTSELEAVVADALKDEKIQAELRKTVTAIMEDPAVSRAIRPYLIQAAVGVALAVAGGIVVGRAVASKLG